jgi:hypothetical protein
MKQTTLLFLAVSVFAGCTCQQTTDAGGGGGSATGGGSAAGGGTATGGGHATGGGSATGGGASTGGGTGTGGGTSDPNCHGFFLALGHGPSDGGTFARGISRDGLSVSGETDFGTGMEQALRWTADGGLRFLGRLPPNTGNSLGHAPSADGRLITGITNGQAYLWVDDGGMLGLGDLPGGLASSNGLAISADGIVIAGTANNAFGTCAASWSATGGWVDYGLTPDAGHNSALTGVTPDHQWFSGWQDQQAIRLRSDGGLDALGAVVNGVSFTTAWGISDDGATLTGIGNFQGEQVAVLWSADGGTVRLPNLISSGSGGANAISGDGTLIAGQAAIATGFVATLWDRDLTPTAVKQLLTTHGVTVPSGWVLVDATAITVNGKRVTVAGNGTLNGALLQDSWVAQYCLP